ncbi:MAG TPA: polyhydroxyalkanoic acid system family protein [Polyangia bacterium]
MPKFDLDIPHSLSAPEAKSRLQRASSKLEQEYGAACSWDGDSTLVVARKGLSARVGILPEKLHVAVELGLLFSAMAGPIRNGITKQLTELMQKDSGPTS